MRTKVFPSSKRGRFVLGGLAVVGLATFVLAAEEISPDELEVRRERIERMSEVERQSLKRKYDAFLALPEDRKDAFRQLHQTLEDNDAGHNLRNVLWNYDAWLRTLTPWERAEIRAEKNPRARLEIVRRIKAARDNEQIQPVVVDRPSTPSRPPEGDDPQRKGRRGFWRLNHRLNESDFRGIVAAVEKSLTPEARAELGGLPAGVHRDVRILLASTKQTHGDNIDAIRRLWPADDLMRSMVDAIHDEQVAKLLDEDVPADQRRRHLRYLTLNALRKEAEQELNRRVPDKEERIREYFRNLSQPERERLERFGFEGRGDKGDFLAWRYLEKTKDPFALDLIELRKILIPPRPEGRSDSGRRQRRPGGPDDKFDGRRTRDGAGRPPREGRPNFSGERRRDDAKDRPEEPAPPEEKSGAPTEKN